MKKRKKFICLLAALLMTAVTGCSGSKETTAASQEGTTIASKEETTTTSQEETSTAGNPVKVIKIAVVSTDKPKTFVDDDGNITGYDVEVLKQVDELLEGYQFEFEAMDYESMLVGVETGAYEMGSNSLMKTPAREEKFLFPEQNLGVTLTKLIMRADQTDLDTLDDVAAHGFKLVPMPANWGTFAVVKEYNETHPDAPVQIENIESLDRADAYRWIVEGRYDAFVTTIDGHAVTAEGLGLMDQLKVSESVLAASPTYCIFNKEQTELAREVSDALKTLKEQGTLSSLAVEWLGEDVFLAADSNES